MHFSIYVGVILFVGLLCDPANADSENETDVDLKARIDKVISSNAKIESQLELTQSTLEDQLATTGKVEQETKHTKEILETILQQSQEGNNKSVDFFEEIRGNLGQISSKIDKIVAESKSHEPVYRIGGPKTPGYPKSCAEYSEEYCDADTCRIKVPRYSSEEFVVACDKYKEEKGWTVIQKRQDGTENFQRNWVDYKSGFGSVNGEYWIGLDKLHALTTTQGRQELLVILEDYHDNTKYARYDAFEVGPESQRYKLKLGAYKGDAGDSLSYHENAGFHTKDNDGTRRCVRDYKGGWWYKNCLRTNPNGIYYRSEKAAFLGSGIYWKSFIDGNYSLKSIKLLIRPKDY
uniref:Fibrinogen C-terminal domain-containing protein n=1 Tax=Glossina austeni TaxID=7395 RepID=A0A1A9VP79_GLOAU